MLSKYRLILLSTLFLICTISLFSLRISPERLIMTNSQLSGNGKEGEEERNLVLKTNDSSPVSPGLKVEIVPISGPVSLDSGDDHLSTINHLIEIYSKKKSSLISHSNLIITKTIHLSPLITRLQI